MQLTELGHTIGGTAFLSLRCEDGVARGLRIPAEALSLVEVIEPTNDGVRSRPVGAAIGERTAIAF